MAYVEIWKSGKLVTLRQVDDKKASGGLKVRLGSIGHVCVELGESKKLGDFEVRVVTGEPPPKAREVAETASLPAVSADSHVEYELSSHRGDDARPLVYRKPRIDGYRIIDQIGGGGMGAVWRAEQLSTRREVALKVMVCRKGDQARARARFEREVELTARLNHPNIGRVYDSGLQQGMYYYAMEFIDGMPLDRYVKHQGCSRREILALMRIVCEAVDYAHLRGIIHRDLKPSNIMVGKDGKPRILDFGLAVTFLEEHEGMTISIEGDVAGTPAYMSPEQALGHHEQLDTRTDVFSLGVILFCLLTGQSPHDLSGNLYDVLRRIIEGRIKKPREADPSIDGELEALLLRALANDPEERYASAGELADDIGNFLNGEPLRARPFTTLYFLKKKAAKHRRQVAIAAVVFSVFLVTFLIVYGKLAGERALRKDAQRDIELKLEELGIADLELRVLGRDKREAQAALTELLDRYSGAQNRISELNDELGRKQDNVPLRAIDIGGGRPMSPASLVRSPDLPAGIKSWTLETCGHRGGITGLAYLAGGRLVSASEDRTARLWDGESGRLVDIFVADSDYSTTPDWLTGITEFQFDSAIRTIATSRSVDTIAAQHNIRLPDGAAILAETATAGAASAGGATLVLGDRYGTIRFIDVGSRRVKALCQSPWCGGIGAMSLSPDGRILAVTTDVGALCQWGTERWQPLRGFMCDWNMGGSSADNRLLAWSPDGIYLVVANRDPTLLSVVGSETGHFKHLISANGEKISSVAWSPDGGRLVVGTVGGAVMLVATGAEPSNSPVTLGSHSGAVTGVGWSANAETVISGGADGRVRMWDPTNTTQVREPYMHSGAVTCLAISGDGQRIVSGGDDKSLQLWNQQRRYRYDLHTDPDNANAASDVATSVAWSPDGAMFAVGHATGNIYVWNADSRKAVHSFSADCRSVECIAWSADSKLLLCGGADGTIRAWNAAEEFDDYMVGLPLRGDGAPAIAISPEGDYRASRAALPPDLRYVIEAGGQQKTLNVGAFRKQHGWVNEPWQVGRYVRGLEKVQRIYVNAACEGPHDGLSWATAFDDLQDALSLATQDTDIWVARGVYKPDRGTGARRASFRMKNGVRLLGGFSGVETSAARRNPGENQTILSGDLKGDDGPDFVSNDENSYHVVTASGTRPDAVLDGFVITGGNANGPSEGSHDWGGGLYTSHGDATIQNCIFKHNSALEGGGLHNAGGGGEGDPMTVTNCMFIGNIAVGQGSIGGAVYNSNNASFSKCTFIDNSAEFSDGAITNHGDVVITDCNFVNNSSANGGGGMGSHHSVPVLTNCTFAGNSTEGSGGGLSIMSGSALIADCIFKNNSAGSGGGIYSWTGAPVLTSCTFVDNSAAEGGGILSTSGNPTLVNCRFIRNSAERDGGGVYSQGGDDQDLCKPMFVNCVLLGNTATSGGGMYNRIGCSPVLINCVFNANAATEGGAVMNLHRYEDRNSDFVRNNEPVLINCTLVANKADLYAGGILDHEHSASTIVNCILWGNSRGNVVDESAQFDNSRTELTSVVRNSCIQGWTGKLGGVANSGNDPLFVDADGPDNKVGTEDDDLRLVRNSPCVDSGDSTALPADIHDLDDDGDAAEPIPLDIYGRPRVDGGRVDIGACEADQASSRRD